MSTNTNTAPAPARWAHLTDGELRLALATRATRVARKITQHTAYWAAHAAGQVVVRRDHGDGWCRSTAANGRWFLTHDTYAPGATWAEIRHPGAPSRWDGATDERRAGLPAVVVPA